ncbi:MAG TPA: hypothetical protein VN285_07795 [Candidatus Deferrimicrobium sp.]|nr:hypothetical protein [Candidatus Deferrimicrobium sp.]
MRSRKQVALLGVTLLAGILALVLGCGSDNKSTDNPANYGDPEFLVVQGEMENFVDSTLESFTTGMGAIYQLEPDTTLNEVFFGPGPFEPPTDSISASYGSGWHVVYIGLDRTLYYLVIRDSVQFLKEGQPQQEADGLDSLRFHHQWAFRFKDTTVSHRDGEGNANYYFGGLNTSVTTINGTNDRQVWAKFVSEDSTVWRSLHVEASVYDVQLRRGAGGWVQHCPSSGSISATIEMVYQKDLEAPDTTVWQVNTSFEDGSVTTTVTKSGFAWTYTKQRCTPPSL